MCSKEMDCKSKIIANINDLKEFYNEQINNDSVVLTVNQQKSLYYQVAEQSIKQFKGFISNLDILIQEIEK